MFPVQLTTSRTGNLTRLIHTLAMCVTIHTYILQDDSARSDLPAGGQEELGGVTHSERMMDDMMKMLANLTIQNQQLLQQHLHQQQHPAAAAGDRGLQQQMAAGEGGRVQEPGGAREGRIVDSSGLLVGETSAKLESLSGEGRQGSLARWYVL